MSCYKSIVIFFGILFGLLSAFLWIKSSTSFVKAVEHDNYSSADLIDSDGNDVVETLKKQSYWNKLAAAAAAIAAFLQAISGFNF